MEIYRIGTALFADGKAEESTKAHTRLVQYFNEKYSKYGHWEFWNSMDGESHYHWVERWKSFAAFEEGQAAWAADPRSKAWAEESRGLYVPASVRWHFYRVQA